MAHPASVRHRARAAYVTDGLPISAAAQAAGVTPSTARGWKRRAAEEGDDWDAAREAAARAKGGLGSATERILTDFSRLYGAVMADLRDDPDLPPEGKAKSMATLSDAYSKMVRAAGCVDPRLARMDIALEVLRLFGEHVRARHPASLQDVSEALDSFGPALAAEWG